MIGPRPDRPPPQISLLRMGVGRRLGLAAAALAVLWLTVAWSLS